PEPVETEHFHTGREHVEPVVRRPILAPVGSVVLELAALRADSVSGAKLVALRVRVLAERVGREVDAPPEEESQVRVVIEPGRPEGLVPPVPMPDPGRAGRARGLGVLAVVVRGADRDVPPLVVRELGGTASGRDQAVVPELTDGTDE